MPGTANSLNITQPGIVCFDGIATFTGRTLTPGAGIAITNGDGISSNPTISLVGGGIAVEHLTGDTGGALNPDGSNNFNLIGSGSVTVTGSGSTLTHQLTGLTNHTVLVGAGTSTITKVGPGSSGQVLQSGGASADPAYSTATYPSTATGTGTLLRADGTNWSATTSTYPNTNAANTLLYASSANVMSALATANSAVLATDASGVPSITATPTVTSIKFGTGTALSNYLEGTFTPGIAFGGGTTGVTYGTQSGTYVRIGRVIYVSVLLTLTNKGSSTGSATITGFPVAVGVTSQIMWARGDLVSYPAGDSVIFAVANSGTSFSLFGTGSNVNATALADTNFNNTSSININGFYLV